MPKRSRRQIDDVGGYDRNDPDGQIFQDEHEKAQTKTALVFLQEPLIVQKARTAFFSVFRRGVLVEQVFKIGDHIVAALILGSFRPFRRTHTFSLRVSLFF